MNFIIRENKCVASTWITDMITNVRQRNLENRQKLNISIFLNVHDALQVDSTLLVSIKLFLKLWLVTENIFYTIKYQYFGFLSLLRIRVLLFIINYIKNYNNNRKNNNNDKAVLKEKEANTSTTENLIIFFTMGFYS